MADMNGHGLRGLLEENISTGELISEVRKAIRAVAVGGQSYRIGSHSLTRANLTELKNLLRYLQEEAAAEAGRGGLFNGVYVVDFEPR